MLPGSLEPAHVPVGQGFSLLLPTLEELESGRDPSLPRAPRMVATPVTFKANWQKS